MDKKIEEVREGIAKVKAEVAETEAQLQGTRGPVQDAVKVTIGMVNDLLHLNDMLLQLIEAGHRDMISKTDPRLYGSQ